MAIIKCKMCGGDLEVIAGSSVMECEYCGTQQTVPNADNEKKLTLFGRANRLRMACEFDKAAGVYESIVAEFPAEAEAYWGLVLCKYGIEYVDDPATGKKIPTCHRSSFDSVMDDSNLEQALENADAVARKVYREEAKAMEELRRGIIEVSGREEPYDIFICYKETAENGDRTIDSVIAQDVYDALTEKGYRVFFSRITLEDKLGQEYEPYIFAALHSAKIMLAFGTDYEYYNAVWVKNEWSRFLQLIAAGEKKTLIPCYKGIDAYDMPKEFARLQAQDMGKVGAIQDLLRGIEKIIPKAAPVTVVQERVVVGGSGDNKIVSLLDRGNMALEDGDWAKADSFFEDVLNNDSKNAQAYLGKTLAQEQCRTIDAFVRKRKATSQNVQSHTLTLTQEIGRADAAVDKYTLSGFVDASGIRKLYDYDRSYPSYVASRQQQYQNEVKYWAEHKLLSRAEQFAVGAVAENLSKEKTALFAELKERIKKAEESEATARQSAQQKYEQHLQAADAKAEKLYEDGLKRREADYQNWAKAVKTETDIDELMAVAEHLTRLGEYKESTQLIDLCNKRAKEIRTAEAAEAERQRIIREKEAKARAAKKKRIGIIAGLLAVIAVVAAVVVTQIVIPQNKYNEAIVLGQLDPVQAFYMLTELGDYKDADEQIKTLVAEAVEEGNQLFARLEEIPKAYFMEDAALSYKCAVKLFDAGQLEMATEYFGFCHGYEDAESYLKYIEGAIAASKDEWDVAITCFENVPGFLDADIRRDESIYNYVLNEKDLPLDDAIMWLENMASKDDTVIQLLEQYNSVNDCSGKYTCVSYDGSTKTDITSGWDSNIEYRLQHGEIKAQLKLGSGAFLGFDPADVQSYSGSEGYHYYFEAWQTKSVDPDAMVWISPNKAKIICDLLISDPTLLFAR